MLVDFTLIVFIKPKADIVGTTSVSNHKLITRSALAAVQVTIHFRFVNTHASFTGGTEHGVMVRVVQTVRVNYTLGSDRRIANSPCCRDWIHRRRSVLQRWHLYPLTTDTILPLNVTSHTVANGVDPWHALASLVVGEHRTGSRNNSSHGSIEITPWTTRMTICSMLVHLALVVVIETKANIVGTTSIRDNKVIARGTLAAVQVAINSRFGNTHSTDTRWTVKDVDIVTVQTVHGSYTLSCHGNGAGSSSSSSCWLVSCFIGGDIGRSSGWLSGGSWGRTSGWLVRRIWSRGSCWLSGGGWGRCSCWLVGGSWGRRSSWLIGGSRCWLSGRG
jgi:hypothetical protein